MIDPRQMNQLMRRMGITPKEIECSKVIIEGKDKDIIIENPSVMLISFQGQNTFQIIGNYREEKKELIPPINEEDIRTVIEQTGKDREEVEKVLKEVKGDLAEAILRLKE